MEGSNVTVSSKHEKCETYAHTQLLSYMESLNEDIKVCFISIFSSFSNLPL